MGRNIHLSNAHLFIKKNCRANIEKKKKLDKKLRGLNYPIRNT